MNDLLIENVCRRVLNEYLGVSDEVEEVSYQAFSMIMSYFNNSRWAHKMVNDVELVYKVFDLDCVAEELGNSVLWKAVDNLSVTLYGYDPSDITFEDYKEFLKKLDKKLINVSFCPSFKEITIRMPMPLNGEIDNACEQYLISGLYHEFEHAWQSANKGGTKISNSYKKALKPINWNSNENRAIRLLKYYVKHCYYAFDSEEIDAKLHELWFEINNGISNLEESEAYRYMREAIEDYKKVVEMVHPKDDFYTRFYQSERDAFLDVLKTELGLNSANQWFKYCKKGIKKYNDQLRRIVGRLYIERGTSGNGSFRQYSQNEIPQEYMFRLKRENPSLWRKIVNKFKS